jgi:2-dehydro-3-deoxyphosphogluconate aldolase/(4S)-4-hydroxy-2-oxoglutarate aldolase
MAHYTRGKIQPRSPIAIVRLDDLAQAVEISQALLAGGIVVQEFTLTNPHALEALAQVKKKLPGELVLGAGTVLDAEMARSSIAAGAEFLVTPAFLIDVIAVGRDAGIPVLSGAFTPSEILGAWRAGADLVKVFPAGGVGPAYIKDVLGPLPTIPLVPTGGVNLDNCAAFLAAGAYTVAIGSSLVNKELVRRQDWPALIGLARRYVQACTPR